MNIEQVRSAVERMVQDDADGLKYLLDSSSELLNFQSPGGKNWLHQAANHNSPKVIEMLTTLYPVDSTDEYGRTSLSLAAISACLPAAETLIKLGANVNHGGEHSPLSCAVYGQSKGLLKLLIENGANNETKEELIRFGRGQGYKNIEEDLNELNYVSAITETFKDKLSAHYGALTNVQSKESPCVLYSKQAKGKFAVFSENINKKLNHCVLYLCSVFEKRNLLDKTISKYCIIKTSKANNYTLLKIFLTQFP